MSITPIARKMMNTGLMLIIVLIILSTSLCINSLYGQGQWAEAIKKTGRLLVRSHTTDLAIYQGDIARIRYRRTGLNLFRLAYEQASDSLQEHINELKFLTQHDPDQRAAVDSAASGIADLKQYWAAPANGPAGGKSKMRTALEEETKIYDIRAELSMLEGLLQKKFTVLNQSHQNALSQTRTMVISLGIVTVLIALICLLTNWRLQRLITKS